MATRHLTASATYEFDRLVVGINLDGAADNLLRLLAQTSAPRRDRDPPVPVDQHDLLVKKSPSVPADLKFIAALSIFFASCLSASNCNLR